MMPCHSPINDECMLSCSTARGWFAQTGTSVSQLKFPHFRKAGQTILPIKFVDDRPHDKSPSARSAGILSPEIFPDYFSGMSKCFRTFSSAPENGFLRGDHHPHVNASATAISTRAAKIVASASVKRHIPFSHGSAHDVRQRGRR